jgi:fumarylpyruvate hydrolase
MDFAFQPPPAPAVPVSSGGLFPVRRIFCVARNYAEHAREMGSDPVREPPFFFTKPADAVVASGALLPFPPRTANLHHEVELVVAIGRGGADIPAAKVEGAHIFGYAVGIDLTRRDLQAAAKAKGQPWDMAKGFDRSAPVGPIAPLARSGVMTRGRIELRVNGEVRQSGDIADMIWPVAEIVQELSAFVELAPGDLIFTGTPAGVGPVVRGDRLEARIDGLDPLTVGFA